MPCWRSGRTAILPIHSHWRIFQIPLCRSLWGTQHILINCVSWAYAQGFSVRSKVRPDGQRLRVHKATSSLRLEFAHAVWAYAQTAWHTAQTDTSLHTKTQWQSWAITSQRQWIFLCFSQVLFFWGFLKTTSSSQQELQSLPDASFRLEISKRLSLFFFAISVTHHWQTYSGSYKMCFFE